MTTTIHDDLVTYEQARLEAETRKLAAEADRAEHDADLVRLEAQSARLDWAERMASDFRNHVYHFNGPVSPSSVSVAQKVLSTWSRTDPRCDVEIVFNSPGGDVFAGMALWDYIQYIRSQGHRVTTNCRGYAASMGGILLQAGDVRVMGRESYLMIHEISTLVSGKASEIEDEAAFLKKIGERVIAIFTSRSNLTATEIKKKWSRKDWWIPSDEALALGLVDEVR